jgi:hypothetical protein
MVRNGADGGTTVGITVKLETEQGRVVEALDDYPFGHLLADNVDRSFVCWRFIDPYGDTVFNNLQMADFLAEPERVRTRARGPADQRLLDALRDLGRRCQVGVHLYLRFYGD